MGGRIAGLNLSNPRTLSPLNLSNTRPSPFLCNESNKSTANLAQPQPSNKRLPVSVSWWAGVPLALELAASWLRIYTIPEIVNEIEKNLDFLTTSARNMPERHRSLRAVFTHSWELLSEAEQTLLRQLSIFQGGFRRETVLAITQCSPLTLVGLIDKSLIQRLNAERYEIHSLLQGYAEEKLAEIPELQHQIKKDYAQYFADLLQQLGSH